MGPWMMDGWSGGGGAWWGLFSFVFMALVIGGTTLLVIWGVRQTGPSSGGDMPLDILKRRYARGEIARDQYEQMRRDLE